MNLTEAAQVIQNKIDQSERVQAWKRKIADGEAYSDPQVFFEVDPVNIVYTTKELQVGISIGGRAGSARVIVSFPLIKWRFKLEGLAIDAVLGKAIDLAEWLWNNHWLEEEGTTPHVMIAMEPPV